jgi:tetratricopeptide (TPR) repeat protein
MSLRIGSVLLCLLALPAANASARGWQSAQYGVTIDAFPPGWKVRQDAALVRLEKVFNKDGYGYEYNENMTFAISLGESATLQAAAAELAPLGYLLEERSRVQLDGGTVPLWIFFHQASNVEVSHVAVVLRAGLVYTFEARGTPLDSALPGDFKALIAAFHFLPDARQEAWNALESQDAKRAHGIFEKLARAEAADGNALYGLGLAELALGKSKDALAHLKQADAILGLGDARLALGQAYSQTGDPVRAVTTFIQLVRDQPARGAEVWPYVEDALSHARLGDSAITAERKALWEDYVFFAGVAAIDLQDALNDARSGDFNSSSMRLREIEKSSEMLFSGALDHLIVEGGRQVEAHYLAGAYQIRNALHQAVTGLQKTELPGLEEAELLLVEALEGFYVATPGGEVK